MRLSDLLHSEVLDADGRRVGTVQDVLVAREDPLLSGHVGALRVEGLVVGGAQGIRLGFSRGGARGPWPISALFRRLGRRARFVPWHLVEQHDAGHIRLTAPAGSLTAPPQP